MLPWMEPTPGWTMHGDFPWKSTVWKGGKKVKKTDKCSLRQMTNLNINSGKSVYTLV